ncbi:MAG: gliding motility-associated C-terminal domain-containing protein [Saprospiraceae bacterium]|nr:gliding motility-associated C-terminal domain-containing protein [Saprospiraceae bacterium]
MNLRIFYILFLIYVFSDTAVSQCPEITETRVLPDCIPSCEVCENDVLNIQLRGADLPNGGKIDYYFSDVSGFNPYNSQGTKIGSANINTPGGNCRICPELVGFIIDACGSEANNEFMVIWTGSGFNTSSFSFDFDANNNVGAGNGDMGSTCPIAPGPAGMVSCMATSVGSGYNLPGNAFWIIFTSSNPTYAYDFSSVCGFGLKVFVSKNSCSRTAGAFSNVTSTGIRTQSMSISGCSCGSSVSYDTDDPSLMGEGDAWAGGITNGGCAASISGAGNYTPAISTIDPFSYPIPKSWCGKTYEIVGIVNPKPDPMCCSEIFTERFEVSVKCPTAIGTNDEVCEEANGQSTFNLEDYESSILGPGGQGTVEWFRNPNGTSPITSPFTTGSITIYARVLEGKCKSDLVPVILKVNPLPIVNAAKMDLCGDRFGGANFRISDLVNTIAGNNSSLRVKFFEDPELTIEISSPYYSSTTIVYAITINDHCESKPVEIKLNILPGAPAFPSRDTICDLGDSTGIFYLKKLDSLVTGGMKVDSIKYFLDSLATKPIKDSLKTTGQTIWAISYQSPCNSMAVPIILFVRKAPSIPMMAFKLCEEVNGNATFDLNIIIDSLHKNDPNLDLRFFEDKDLTKALIPPIVVKNIDTIYLLALAKDCFLEIVPIVLTVYQRPLANKLTITVCGDENGEADFILNDLEAMITGGLLLDVEFFEDSLLVNRISGNYKTKGQQLFAITKDSICQSIPATIDLQVILTPKFHGVNDTVVCQHMVLIPILGQNLSANASYYLNEVSPNSRLQTGDSLFTSSWIYLIDSTNACLTLDSFYVDVFQKSSAGSDMNIKICEGQLIDLNNYTNGHSGGIFLDSLNRNIINVSTLNSTGFSGQTIQLWYVVDGGMKCGTDTAILKIEVQVKLSVGQDRDYHRCESENLVIDLRQEFGVPDVRGTFYNIDQLSALNGYIWDANISGPGTFQFYYWLDAGANCSSDSAEFTLYITESPKIDSLAEIIACNKIILPPITGKFIGNNAGYFTNQNGNGVRYQSGDTIQQSILLYAYASDSSGKCFDEFPLNVQIGTVYTYDFIKNDLCPDEFFIIGQNRYDKNKPIGQETLKASSSSECDSIVNIQLVYLNEARFVYQTSICENDFIAIQGNRYDLTNPSGIEILKGGSHRSCDSIVEVNLSFYALPNYLLTPYICGDDSVLVNGRSYHRNHLVGTDTLKGASFQSCDSIVQVRATHSEVPNFILRDTLCSGEFLIINGRRIDSSNTSIFEIHPAQSSNQCDSIVDIQVYFYPVSKGKYEVNLCNQQEIIIQQTKYNRTNPSGIEILKSASYTGCDSTLEISLSFQSELSSIYKASICRGDSVLIGTKYYSENRLTDRDTLFKASFFGCDSVVIVELDLVEPTSIKYTDTLCPQEFVLINGNRYDQNKASGFEVLQGANQNGCDSIIDIQLEFVDLIINHQNQFSIQLGDQLNLSFTANFIPVSIEWSPSEGLSCTDCPEPIASPTENTNYTLRLTDKNGCEIFGQFQILVLKNSDVFIPNGFTPNGDQVNDLFKIHHAPVGTILKNLNIFDRWGAQIFQETNVLVENMQGWNGHFNGVPVVPGVYIYYLTYQLPDLSEKIIYGDISLIR